MKHQIIDLILHLTFPLKQPQKNKPLMLYLNILDNIPYNQNKKTLLTFFQNREPHQLNSRYPQLPRASDIQQLNPSETATIQNASEFSEETVPTVQNTPSLTLTNDSNLIQVRTHNITQDETNNQNQDNTLSTTQDNTSILSTSHKNVTQPSQTQRSPHKFYDPPFIPPQFSTQIHTHNSPQQGCNTQHTNTVHFQTPTPPSPPKIQTSTYTPAQSNPVQNAETSLKINTIHSNPLFNYTTSRHLSRPPLQPILTNPLSYNLTNTNSSHTHQSSTNNNRPNSLNTFPPPQTSNTITPSLQNSQFKKPNPPSTNIRTNPHFHNTPTYHLSYHYFKCSYIQYSTTIYNISKYHFTTNIYQPFYFKIRTYKTF